MRVLLAHVNMKLLEDSAPQPIVSNHAFNGVLDQKCGLLPPNVPYRIGMVTADEARIPHVSLGHLFFPGKGRPSRVDHDDMVTRVDVRRIVRLVLAAKQNCRALRNPTDGLIRCIQYVPRTPNLGGFRTKTFHGKEDNKEARNDCQARRINSSWFSRSFPRFFLSGHFSQIS